MKCREFQSLIADYLHEAIEDPKREEFEAHFFACRKCFLGLKINENLQSKCVPVGLEEKPRLFALKLFKPMLAMASLFLLILFSALLVQQNRETRRLREISAFEIPPYHQGEMRNIPAGGDAEEERFSRAMQYLQNGEFRPALSLLEQTPPDADANPKVQFFRAICYLGDDKPGKAGEILNGIIQAMDPAYFDEALYYKGFVLLRQGKKQAARAQFKKLAGMLSPMSLKARVMLQKIDKI